VNLVLKKPTASNSNLQTKSCFAQKGPIFPLVQKERRESPNGIFLSKKRCEHRRNDVNTVVMFFLVQNLPLLAFGLQEGGAGAGRVCPVWNTCTQPWSSPREEGLRSKWNEPRDPAASLADQPLRRRAAKSRARCPRHGRARRPDGGHRRSQLRGSSSPNDAGVTIAEQQRSLSKWKQTFGSGGAYNSSVCTVIRSERASLGEASSGGASFNGAGIASMASYASSLQHAYHKEVPTTGDEAEDPILEATDKALATFSSKRQLMLDLGKDAFFEHAWKVKCVGTIVRNGRVYVTLETISGETPSLTQQEKGKRFDLSVS
jgi:hypothetical protein